MPGPSANLGQDAAEAQRLTALQRRSWSIAPAASKAGSCTFKLPTISPHQRLPLSFSSSCCPVIRRDRCWARRLQPLRKRWRPTLLPDGPVLYALTPNMLPKPGGFVFAAGVKTIDIKRVEVTYYRMRGFTKIGVIATTDASGQEQPRRHSRDSAPSGKQGCEARPDVESFGLSDVSMAAQATRLKAAGRADDFRLFRGHGVPHIVARASTTSGLR